MEHCQDEIKGACFATLGMHETSSDWDAREKVVKPDQASNSFFKGQSVPKGWQSLGGTCLPIQSIERLRGQAYFAGRIRDSSLLTNT